MPLIRSTSNVARSQNIREMIDAGHPPKQAEAAAYRNQAQADATVHHAPTTQHVRHGRITTTRKGRNG